MKSPCKSCLSNICVCLNNTKNLYKNDVEQNIKEMKHSLDHWCKNITPDKNRQLRFQNNYSSPLQTIKETECSTDAANLKISTPSRSCVDTASNPFDVEIDSLHLSSFSPSVFASFTRQETLGEGSSFRWSIDQLSVLKPADIDETSQQELWLDSEKEVKAQKAIDTFFSKNHIAPSPWGPPTQYMSCVSQLSSCKSQIEACKSSCPTPNFNQNDVAKEVCTQTMLSIPPNIDLDALLGHFYTYHEERQSSNLSDNSSNDVDMLSTSSLRRKLFMNQDEDISSPVKNKEEQNQKSEPIQCNTPESKTAYWCATPASDHFSSSPITPRNCSIPMSCAGHLMSSPPISPICIADKSHNSGSTRSWRKSQKKISKFPNNFMSTDN